MNRRLRQVAAVARAAGREILEVYHAAGGDAIEVETKDDGSPVTIADRRAHDVIQTQLARLAPEIPLLSEESGPEAFEARRGWRRFWLVDPLDGTRGFIRRDDQFTVNIALIDAGRPVLGVVFAPLTGVLYAAAAGDCAVKVDAAGSAQTIRVKPLDRARAVLAVSRAHAGARTVEYRARLEDAFGAVDTVALGSSLKICLVAEGAADILPQIIADVRVGFRGRALRVGSGRWRRDRCGRPGVALQQSRHSQPMVLRRRLARVRLGGVGAPAIIARHDHAQHRLLVPRPGRAIPGPRRGLARGIRGRARHLRASIGRVGL